MGKMLTYDRMNPSGGNNHSVPFRKVDFKNLIHHVAQP